MEGGNFFAGSNLDRQADMRPDKSCMESILAQDSTKILLLSAMNPLAEVIRSEDGAESCKILFVTFANVLRLLEVAEMDHGGFAKRIVDEGHLIFLGSSDSVSYFALDISELGDNIYENGLLKHAKVLKSRIELLQLNEIDASLVAQSRSLLDWNRRYRFCPTCGSTTSSVDAGYKRQCSNGDCLSNKGEFGVIQKVCIHLLNMTFLHTFLTVFALSIFCFVNHALNQHFPRWVVLPPRGPCFNTKGQ